jgi:hypothetical protein
MYLMSDSWSEIVFARLARQASLISPYGGATLRSG